MFSILNDDDAEFWKACADACSATRSVPSATRTPTPHRSDIFVKALNATRRRSSGPFGEEDLLDHYSTRHELMEMLLELFEAERRLVWWQMVRECMSLYGIWFFILIAVREIRHSLMFSPWSVWEESVAQIPLFSSQTHTYYSTQI